MSGAEGQHPDQRRAFIEARGRISSAIRTKPRAGPVTEALTSVGASAVSPALGVVTRSRSRGRGSYVSCRWRAVRVRRADGDDDPSRAPRAVSAPRALWF